MIRGIIVITILEDEKKEQDIKLLVEDGGIPLTVNDMFSTFANVQKRLADIIKNQERVEKNENTG